MAAVFLSAKLIYRRMDLLNVAAISALVILAARPSEITDASFLLSFSAVATIGAIAVPCIARSSEPYRLALDHLSDVTRDVSHAPRVIQFRLEMRAAAAWISARLPRFAAPFGSGLLVRPFRAAALFLGDHFHFRHPSARNASSACLLFSSRRPGRTIRQCSSAFADGISCSRLGSSRWPLLSCLTRLRVGLQSFWDSSSRCSTQPCDGSQAGTARATAFRGRPSLSWRSLSGSRLRYPRPFACVGDSGGHRAPRSRWWPLLSSSQRIRFRRVSRPSAWN